MNSKVLNDLSARIARIEALMENNDTFSTAAPSTDGGFNYQGSQFGGVQFGDNYFQTQDGSGLGGYQPYNLDQQLEENYGFGPTDATITDLMNRIAELELMVAGGSRDTQQSGSLNAGQSVGDDAATGSGTSGIPAGFTTVTISICDNGVAKTMQVIGTTPA